MTATRIDYSAVRPGMTVTTYSHDHAIEVTAVRHVVRIVDNRILPAVDLSGWIVDRFSARRFADHCYQLPGHRTYLLDDDAPERVYVRDAVMVRNLHSYSDRFVGLDLNIRIDVTPREPEPYVSDDGYRADCDACLYDRHGCEICAEVVGHNHYHGEE